MRTLNLPFEDAEYELLEKLKREGESWHDCFVRVANRIALEDEAGKYIEVTAVRRRSYVTRKAVEQRATSQKTEPITESDPEARLSSSQIFRILGIDHVGRPIVSWGQ